VNVMINNIDITSLASGNYELVVELKDRNNQLLAKNIIFFQRSNPNIQYDTQRLSSLQIANSFVAQYKNLDTLRQFVAFIYPKATAIEKQFIFRQAKNCDLETLQRFFFNFWSERDAMNPYRAWLEYKKMVDVVNHEYKAVGMMGFQTDRGRVYLQYGPPNTIVDREFDAGSSGLGINKDGTEANDGGTVPYQIWHYYQLSDNQRNKRFVFSNPHLAANSYDLIHSDANGELYNPQWQSELQRQIFKSTTIDENGEFKGESGEYYNVPY
ncbi:MAG: GWxTD domain-containing protein, partial [Bacteroidales bacterium]|nr:GWxTD domain-containing protein [Bacteroidales bacterium]